MGNEELDFDPNNSAGFKREGFRRAVTYDNNQIEKTLKLDVSQSWNFPPRIRSNSKMTALTVHAIATKPRIASKPRLAYGPYSFSQVSDLWKEFKEIAHSNGK